MSGYTFRLAHLNRTPLKVGDIVHRGDQIGRMGNTGQSTGPHGHIDVVKGYQGWAYRLQNIYAGNPIPAFRELHFFIDRELTGGKPFRVTTHVYDHNYVIHGSWKPHPAYDIVIDDPNPEFYWNRSYEGEVIASAFDVGYGNYIQIHYKGDFL